MTTRAGAMPVTSLPNGRAAALARRRRTPAATPACAPARSIRRTYCASRSTVSGGRSSHILAAWRGIRGWFAKRRVRGHDWITIPDQLDPAAVIAEPAVRLHADGVYRVTAELEVAGQPIAQMEHRFLVGDPPRSQRLSAARSD